ncbi:hypothetical protein [Liquorilactobacillus hordei]|nr:hypothetical protein [Liquorilactobacillus hordei]
MICISNQLLIAAGVVTETSARAAEAAGGLTTLIAVIKKEKN